MDRPLDSRETRIKIDFFFEYRVKKFAMSENGERI